MAAIGRGWYVDLLGVPLHIILFYWHLTYPFVSWYSDSDENAPL